MNGGLLIAGFLGLAAIERTTTNQQDFSRYQPIIDRKPFGQVQNAPTEVAPNWLSRFSMVALVMSNSGSGPLQAIIMDKEGNRTYFRAEGETIDPGIKVVRIEPKPPKLVLQNGLDSGTLTFQDRPAAAAAPAAPAPGAPPGTAPAAPTIRRIPFRRGN